MGQNEKKQIKIEEKRKKQFEKYERRFAAHHYRGRGRVNIGEVPGSPYVLLASPFSVSVGEMTANLKTGGLACLLAHEIGCSALYTQKKFKNDSENIKLKQNYAEKIKKIHPQIIIELRTIESESACFYVETFSFDNSDFFNKLAQYVIEYELREKEYDVKVCEIVNHMTMSPLTEAANQEYIPVLMIGINKKDFIDDNLRETYSIVKKLTMLLTEFDWTADSFEVFRIWQANAKSQIPHDKVEFAKESQFAENTLIHISSFEGIQETARVNKVNDKTLNELTDHLRQVKKENDASEYVILTNRLIENLFGREWIEGFEEIPGLRGAPVIVYENRRELYEIGIPKANQVNNIGLSTELYKEKIQLSQKYDYIIFNIYSDSRIYIDVEKSDYGDNGRVKAKDGTPNAKKIMLPRYYRLMLGYLDEPIKTIRAEEYWRIVSNIPKKVELAENGEPQNEISEEDFIRCYKKMPGQAYFQLIEEEKEVFLEGEQEFYKKSIKRIIAYYKKIGVYSQVDLIRIPKRVKPKKKISERLYDCWQRFRICVLKKTIGKAEYILKTNWAGDTDDKNSVVRLNNNMMSLIGVSENDKVLIRFGENTVILRVLPQDNLSDYEIGIPSSGRRALGMNSMNDIVIVHRDMAHAFKRHSQEQTIAILGTVLTVAQVLTAFEIFTKSWVGIVIAIIVCIVAIILMLYFALSEERVKVK